MSDTIQKRCKEIVKQYKFKGIHLTTCGNSKKHGFDFVDCRRIKDLMEIIPRYYFMQKSQSSHYSSYGMKHDMEHFLTVGLNRDAYYSKRVGTYTSNGELIMAMILCGFTPKFYNINCSFNVKKKITPQRASAYILIKGYIGISDITDIVMDYLPPREKAKMNECETCDKTTKRTGWDCRCKPQYARFCKKCQKIQYENDILEW